jgi:Protein of unknown function (DUF3684)
LTGLFDPSLALNSLNLVIRMIKTGDWTTYDLIKYLVSTQSSLTPQEVERLRHTSAFPKEGAAKEQSAPGSRKVQRHKAMDLYEPIDIFRELGLPVVDWGIDTRWKPASDEGKFLCCAAAACPSDSSVAQPNSFSLWV